jgi:AraC-like DNA-binding protein
LLVRYLNLMRDESAFPTPEVQRSAVAHVCDLLAIALGATRDATEMAKRRGVRAARGYAIRSDIMNDLSGELSLGAVAARHRVTPRYVQMLFEDDGTTFTAFVRERRLLRAQEMLADPGFDHQRIGEIAYGVGFNDLSYFIRAFNQRFGMTPSEARQTQCRRNPG